MTEVPIVVVAAVVERDGAFLTTQRIAGAHRAGYWEFPGGKCRPGESHSECLRRELHEELNVDVAVGTEIFATRFKYSDRSVDLHFYRCELVGDPQPLLGQPMRWVRREELQSLPFLEADAVLIAQLAKSGRPL